MQDIISKISISPNESIRKGMSVIDSGAMGFALLINDITHTFEGLVTDGDIRRGILDGLALEDPLSRLIKKHYVTVTTNTPFSETLDYFNQKIKIIPILDEYRIVVDLAVFNQGSRAVPVAEPTIDDLELKYVKQCIQSGWVSSKGTFIDRFEEEFAVFCNTKHAITTCNGTAALHLTLLACDIGPGDEVIMPTLTFIATANAVKYTGAEPIFVDSNPHTWTMDATLTTQAITSKTKAIIPVHLYGHPADIDPLKSICKKHNLVLIEDAAEAHGALYKGQRVGSIGDMGIFSFFGNKILTTGEGGMVVTNSDDYANRIRLFRDHGMDKNRRYWHPVLGYNYRLTNIQAAVGVAQLEKIDRILFHKRQCAKWYKEVLSGTPGLTLPSEMSWANCVFWLYSILIEEEISGISRDDLITTLQLKGIESRPIFHPLHLQPIYLTEQSLPIAEKLARSGLSLPSSVKLTREEVHAIAETILTIFKC